MFIEAEDDGGGGDNWTTGAISRAKLQSNHNHQQTNQIVLYTSLCPPPISNIINRLLKHRAHCKSYQISVPCTTAKRTVEWACFTCSSILQPSTFHCMLCILVYVAIRSADHITEGQPVWTSDECISLLTGPYYICSHFTEPPDIHLWLVPEKSGSMTSTACNQIHLVAGTL